MQPNEFVKLAINTEAPVGPAIERLADITEMEILVNLLKGAIEQADALDVVKAHLYYGKLKQDHLKLPEFNGRSGWMGEVQDRVDAMKRLTDPRLVRLLHAGLGMFTEAGEFMHALFDHAFNGQELDLVNLSEEIGDTEWYCALGSDALGIGLEEIMTKIIAKLKKRYPNKFTEKDATNRDLDAERKILEEK